MCENSQTGLQPDANVVSASRFRRMLVEDQTWAMGGGVRDWAGRKAVTCPGWFELSSWSVRDLSVKFCVSDSVLLSAL